MHPFARYRANPKGPFCVGGALDLEDADLTVAR